MNILGINYVFHDTSACIVRDGELVAAIEEERLTRKKHTQEFPSNAINACLRHVGLSFAEIDHIALSSLPEKMAAEKLAYAARLNEGAASFLSYEFDRTRARHIKFWSWFQSIWPEARCCPQVHFVEHHAAHAAGSYYVCPWSHAALLSIDGWGEWTTTWLGTASGTDVKCLSESFFPDSLGLFYAAATEFCGFKANYDEGKTMGLAPTGNPSRFYDVVDEMVTITPAGHVKLDMSWFAYEALAGGYCGDEFARRFGPPRKKAEEIGQHHRDVAAAFQRVLEDKVIALCRVLEQSTDADYLVLGGGVGLNSVMNGRVLRQTRFKDIYIMPGAGDNGTCIGAAYVVFNGKLGQRRRYEHKSPFLGGEYSNEEIKSTLEKCKLSYRRADDVCRETANLLRAGKIVGWFQGRMEFGPRALGNRSILADPSAPGMKDRLNSEVKHRESFRPFAPSVPVEARDRYFEIPVDSPFMLQVCPVREEVRASIAATVHVDGSARLQTVDCSVNARFHELLTKFGEGAGRPVLLNTSFNIMEEPIVESPLDAIRCFFSTGLDHLVVGDYILSK